MTVRYYLKNKISLKRVSAFFGLLLLVIFSTAFSVSAQTVTQGYSSEKTLQRGTAVSLDAEDTKKVVAASKENQNRLHGIVVASNDAALTLSDESQKTFVATIGRFDGLVSTEAGNIQPGDFLTVSSISGIVMKAGENDLYSIGKAVVGFDGNANTVSKSQLTDSAGNSNEVSIGRVTVDLAVGSNPLLRPADSTLPEFLEKATEAIAGKQVSPVRVYVGLFLLVVAGSIAGSLLYSGIKSSVISIGRNPLSKKSITKSMLQIIITSIIIFLIGILGVYLLLVL
jgi:hypothetical protein